MRSVRSLTIPLLLLVGFNLLPQIHLRPLWVTVSAFCLLALRVALELTRRPMPPKWVTFGAQIALIATVWHTYRSFLGDEAGGTLLSILVVMKTFELKAKRDYFICASLCILVLMSVLLLDQGLTISLFVLMDVIAVLMFLQALEEERWLWKNWRTMLWPSASLVLKSLPLVVILFVLFPRFNTGFGRSSDTSATMGMSDNLHPGSVSRLIGSDEIVFRASFLDGMVPQRSLLYWRGSVLAQSSGLNWEKGQNFNRRSVTLYPLANPDVEIYLEPSMGRFLYSLETTRGIYFPNESVGRKIGMIESRVFELGEPIQTRERYQLENGEVSEEAGNLEPYLQLGEKASPELEKFLLGFKGKPDKQMVMEVSSYFRDGGYSYSLTPPPAASLEDFLFRTKVGFCEHYAGATATILRHLGVPARVVIGFQGGTSSYFDNYISVRGTDAHAWLEYYDRSLNRWHRLDPTSAVAPQRVNFGSETYLQTNLALMPTWLPRGWVSSYLRGRAVVDEVEASWTGFLLRFDSSRQKELLAKFGMEEVMLRALLVFLVLSVGLTLALLYFFEAQKRETLSADEKLYRQLIGKLKKWKIEKSPAEGPVSLMNRLRGANPELALQVEPVLSRLILARYGNLPLTPEFLRDLQKSMRKFKISKA